jgi:hypothetical protein
MAVFEKNSIETKQKTFLIGVRDIDGNAGLKESYSKKENHLNIYIQY